MGGTGCGANLAGRAQESFEQHWPEGRAHMAEICGYHYERESLLATDGAASKEEADIHVLRLVDKACEQLFTRVAEVEADIEAKLDDVLELVRARGARGARGAGRSRSPRPAG